MSKEILKSLLQTVFNGTGKSPADIALEMGYKKNYISEMLTPKGKVTEKFINSFRSKYRYILDNPNNNDRGEGVIISDYKEKYLTALEEIRELQKQLLEKEKEDKKAHPNLKKAN